MKSHMKLSLIAIVLLGCPKNPPGPLPPPSPDASDASAFGDSPPSPVLDDCQKGCAALTAVSCGLGDGGFACADYLRAQNSGKEPNAATHKPLTCADVAKVQTKDDARRLGFVCP